MITTYSLTFGSEHQFSAEELKKIILKDWPILYLTEVKIDADQTGIVNKVGDHRCSVCDTERKTVSGLE